MSEASLQEQVSVESLVARVADEFLERQKNGERPDIEEYAARHPEAADLLRKVLAALDLIGLSQLSGPGLSETAAEPSGTLGDFRITRAGVEAACLPGIVRISAGNLGPFHIHLHKLFTGVN